MVAPKNPTIARWRLLDCRWLASVAIDAWQWARFAGVRRTQRDGSQWLQRTGGIVREACNLRRGACGSTRVDRWCSSRRRPTWVTAWELGARRDRQQPRRDHVQARASGVRCTGRL